MIIIGLTGRAGAGKDTVADMAAERWPIARAAFADALRAEVAEAWGVDKRLFTTRDLKETPLEQLRLGNCRDAAFVQFAWHLSSFHALKPRTIMQTWGDYRRAYNPDYYLLAADLAVVRAQLRDVPAMIITDVRFPNELMWLKERDGHLVRIKRPGLQPVNDHASESRLDAHPADFVIGNGGDLGALRERVFHVFSEILDARDEAAA